MTHINTRTVFNKLVSSGFSEKQAEAFLYGYNIPINTLILYRKLVETGFTEEQSELIVDLTFNSNIANK
jgi:hypothetical protein